MGAVIFLIPFFISNGIFEIIEIGDISCDLLSEEIARMKEKISEIENCVANSQMQWVNDICQKRPTIQVISTSSETDSRIALIEKCISEPSSVCLLDWQVVMVCAVAALQRLFSAKTEVGNCPPYPPATYAPAYQHLIFFM